MKANLTVPYNQITPQGWKCGDMIEDGSKNQYYISDAENGKATLEPIAEIDKVKKEFVFFTLTLEVEQPDKCGECWGSGEILLDAGYTVSCMNCSGTGYID